MRQDWIEFDLATKNKGSLRPEYIVYFEENKDGGTLLEVNDGYDRFDVSLSEPYEQVKQKIMDAEKVGLNDVVVEHFTRDEYETMLTLVRCERDECEQDNIPTRVESMNRLIDKLNKILKEDK